MPKYYREELEAEYVTSHFPSIGSREFEEKAERFSEKFLDIVYGKESKLKRAEFLQKVAKDANWVFKMELVRSRFAKLCECDDSSDDN